MALNNVINKRYPIINRIGQPLPGALIYLYEPGTTTFITSYDKADLQNANAQPVVASGSGRASIWITRDCDLRIEDRNGNLITTEDNINPDSLGIEEAGGLVPNGSFETDADANTVPDGWTLDTEETGSDNELDTTQQTDGSQSFRFTSTGDGGGQLVTTDFFPVNDSDNLQVSFDILTTVATVLNIVRVEWYDVTQVSISNSDAYSSTSNPTSWTNQLLSVAPPANARFAKLRLIGIDPSVLLAGITYFDRVNVFYPAVVSGVFDNLTLQNNEISSTNTNGNIELNPNGTGVVELIKPLRFPATQVADADANTLDDYEEGTFTPELWDGSNSGSESQTYSLQVGNYQKVGRRVNFDAYIAMTSLGTLSGSLRLGNLPFTCINSSEHNAAVYVGRVVGANFAAAGYSLVGRILPNNDYVTLELFDNTAGVSNLVTGDVTASFLLILSGAFNAQ